MDRDELRELLIHAAIDDVVIDGPEYGREVADTITIRFRWLGGETQTVILRGASDVCGWIELEDP